MPDQWSAETNEITPSSSGAVLDYVSSPGFEHAQPFTISFDRTIPTNNNENSAMRAEITYRTGSMSRTVRCDWRGQASLTANQIEVKGRSYPPRPEAYAQSAAPQRYSVMLGLGAVAKSSVLLTGTPLSISTTLPDVGEIHVPRMATRMLLRAALATLPGPTYGEPILEDLIGAAWITLLQSAGPYPFHKERLALSHFTQGIELGEADQIHLEIPSGLASGFVVVTPVFELAL